MGRVMVVGLDGATWEILRPLAEQGRLPTLARLMRDGAHGPLQSATPPITPTAWTSFFTGKNPGKHGVYDFRELGTQSYEWQSSRLDQHKEKTLWQLLGEAGLRSIVIDVPYTHPARPFDGWMITGYGTPRTPGTVFTHPHNLAELLPAELRDEVRVALPRHHFDRSQKFVDEWRAIMAGRERLLRYLLTEQPWDFFMNVFSATDYLAHTFWTYVEPTHPNFHHPDAAGFREAYFWAYERCDELLGKMIEWAGPDVTTLVMSDHGFGSIHPRQYLFQHLVENGFLTYQSAGGSGLLGDRLLRVAMRAYTRLPFLREWVKGLRPQRASALKKTLARNNILPVQQGIDPARSKVIPANSSFQIWVNERGRFAKGIVEPSEKAALLDELARSLMTMRNPSTGKPILTGTKRADELYAGPMRDGAPDLVVQYANFYEPDAAGRANPHLEGGHTESGILLAQGPAIQHGETLGAGLMDLAPTILYLLDQPIPPDMDGAVLTDLLSAEYLATHAPRQGSEPARSSDAETPAPYTAAEEAEVEEQLRRLGYI